MGTGGGSAGLASSFLQNPYYFMFASLAKPDDDTELHWLKVNARFLLASFQFSLFSSFLALSNNISLTYY
ncbi:hypothetical protein BDN71DRAFT_1453448 [Pleurotus eryngii]|uniref:Uncharacterized protein n=1 Tax=Pleurotus eryngii TaxID=5323 RepID=A0A9P5ZR09_PLEER|nr:hypothetical protein BDN71DRAFT_1453448 [Pleurotus eryngii]